MKRLLANVRPLALLLLVFGIPASSARAQGVQGVQLAKLLDGQESNVFQEANFLSSAVLKAEWVKHLPTFNQAIQTKIAELNGKLGRGIKIYHQRSELSKNLEVTISMKKNVIHAKMAAKRNVLFFKTTTPGPFGSYADPKFSLTFDLDFDTQIVLPSAVQPLHATKSIVTVKNVSWDSQNFAGDLVKIANSVDRFVTGHGFMSKLNDSQTFNVTNDVNAQLSKLNEQLNRLQSEGFQVLESTLDAQTHRLKMLAKKTL